MYAPDLMDCFTSNIIPDAAYIWACKTRIHNSHNNIVKNEFDLLGYNLNLERLKLSKNPIKPCKAKIVKAYRAASSQKAPRTILAKLG